jgi:hypothetical protein
MFRLVRSATSFNLHPDSSARIAAWIAAAIYAANPNLLYVQSTAMTESLYLALFLWSLVYFTEFVQQNAFPAPREDSKASASLMKCGLCLASACLTRYDGWFLATLIMIGALFVVLSEGLRIGSARGAFRKFVLIVAAVPILWFGYNAIVYRNPLEFANGPYSAHAIELTNPASHPGAKNLAVAATYFMKAAETNLVESYWQKVWLVLAFLGTVLVLLDRRIWPLLLLWAPLPFYALSVAYGSVPVYVPAWWPFSYYNVRYGIELLPAFAGFLSVAVYFGVRFAGNSLGKLVPVVMVIALMAGSYAAVWRAEPVCFREAWTNSRTRIALETQVAEVLKQLPVDSTILMYLGNHVGALEQAGVPLKRTINESNHRPWMRPSDPDGLWEKALADPKKYADFVVAFEGDLVAEAMKNRKLYTIEVLHAYGQAPATIYLTNPVQR